MKLGLVRRICNCKNVWNSKLNLKMIPHVRDENMVRASSKEALRLGLSLGLRLRLNLGLRLLPYAFAYFRSW